MLLPPIVQRETGQYGHQLKQEASSLELGFILISVISMRSGELCYTPVVWRNGTVVCQPEIITGLQSFQYIH